MKNFKSIILNIVTLIIFVITFISLLRFLEVDNCLDAGGMFNYEQGICISPREGYSALLWRDNLLLWIITITISIIPAILMRKLLSLLGLSK